jgi:hypothetical protein
VKRTLWFERTFNFQFPVGVFPVILERLRGTPARLEDMVREFPPTILTKRIDSKWSIQEHIGHLYDLEELHDRRVDDYLNGAETLRSADLKNEKTNRANHNATAIDKLLASFRKNRTHFVQRLEQLDDETLARQSIHPRLQQSMRVVDFAYFVAEHDDHHIASMRELYRILARGQKSEVRGQYQKT